MAKNPFPQPISEQIWEGKYKLNTSNPNIHNDITVEHTWERIANTCSGYVEKEHGIDGSHKREQERDRFYSALSDFKFLPAGRITAGAGSGRNVTLFNCYVMGTIPDSLPGIFDMLKEAALTMQQGGGIGYDFTTLRPKNAPVKGVDADASGPLSFMDIWDSMCRTIMSAGARRGAMMATMRCDHPDIMDFISAKKDSTRLRMFNMSVLCTDEFMDAVFNDDDWKLTHPVKPSDTSLGRIDYDGNWIYKIMPAKEIWNMIMRNTYAQAEPGILFIDRINIMNNLYDQETISATNPCGEQPLPPYGACLLGSLNLAKMVKDPFTEQATVDYQLIENTAKIATAMLDNVIDISNFPNPKQQEEALKKRRMGIGITGLADMLLMINEVYGSKQSVKIAENVMRTITLACYRESIVRAKSLGPCPATETNNQRQKFVRSGFMKNMPKDIIEGVIAHGIRNALLTSIAPTGTISLYAGNVSSGIEPIFAESFVRKVLEDDGVTKREEVVKDYAINLLNEHRETYGLDTDARSEYIVTAQDLSPKDHLVMQSAVQKWVDSSISKTINCPEDIEFEDFERIYLDAYNMGCKGCTTYRPNDVTGSVLSVESEPKEEEGPSEVVTPEGPVARPQKLNAEVYKLKWEGENFYVTISDYEGKPFEIFINSKNMEHYQWIAALTRMMSAVFRRGGDVTFIVEELKSILDPKGGVWMGGEYVPSFVAFLGDTVKRHLRALDPTEKDIVALVKPVEETTKVKSTPTQCTECKGFNVQLTNGCPTCNDCGHSKCG